MEPRTERVRPRGRGVNDWFLFLAPDFNFVQAPVPAFIWLSNTNPVGALTVDTVTMKVAPTVPEVGLAWSLPRRWDGTGDPAHRIDGYGSAVAHLVTLVPGDGIGPEVSSA